MTKKRVTFSLSEATIDLSKDAVVWVQSKGVRTTLSQFVEDALLARIDAVKETHGVKKIPKRTRELSRGRLVT